MIDFCANSDSLINRLANDYDVIPARPQQGVVRKYLEKEQEI